MNTRLIALHILDEVISLLGVGVALFWSAGRMDWWAAWTALTVWVAWFAAMDFLVLRFNPVLMAERQAPLKGAKPWDRAVLSILRLTQLLRYILAGLDQRYGWAGDFPLAVQLAGLIGCVLGSALFTWAMASNPFFSQIVRIQTEHGHTVATQGPYRSVRHPGYVGMIVFELAISILLDSWWACIAGAVCAALIILRTLLEDRSLRVELPGYVDYSRQVRFRLIPNIW